MKRENMTNWENDTIERLAHYNGAEWLTLEMCYEAYEKMDEHIKIAGWGFVFDGDSLAIGRNATTR